MNRTASVPDSQSYLDKVSTRLHKERPIELHVRPRGGRNFVVELTFTHTRVQLLVEMLLHPHGEPVELHVRLPEKPDAQGTLVNSSSPARGVELRWDLRSPARGGGKGKMGEEGWGGGIEQGGVGTEEEDVPRNMLCQTGVCE
ncbi:hypothetical protein Bbelb_398010 [Branchiostoma belcheri]|nr:hypothetical protein Bbelb_398010 [Branchiostoma belcheri]